MAPLKGGFEGRWDKLYGSYSFGNFVSYNISSTDNVANQDWQEKCGRFKGVLDGGWDGLANGANGDLGHSASARPAVNIQKVILQ